jgi:hypothetical protein
MHDIIPFPSMIYWDKKVKIYIDDFTKVSEETPKDNHL